jgi:uncharacterized protein YbjT (DUF2867 family)
VRSAWYSPRHPFFSHRRRSRNTTDFPRTKLHGDQKLIASQLDWVILRPSVVLGRPVYGASALFRALAILPILPVMPNTGSLQVVQLEEVVQPGWMSEIWSISLGVTRSA